MISNLLALAIEMNSLPKNPLVAIIIGYPFLGPSTVVIIVY